MKTRIYFMLLSVLLSITYLSAQVVQTVNVPTAGGLAGIMGSNLKTVTDLTLKGTINATDFQTIKQMTALKNLDMSGVDVVEKAIPANAFQGRVLNSLSLPVSLEEIQSNAFYGATLSLLDFSKSLNLESLGAGAFNNLTLTEKNELDFSNSSKLANFSLINDAIGVFYNNKSHVILPRAMKVLPRSAFATFYGSVDLPEGLETMAECVFYNSKPSKELILPSTLKSLGRDAFYGATLSLLDFSKSLNLESLGAGAFNNLTLTEKNELDFSNSSKLANFSLINDAIGVFYNNKSHVILPRAMKVLPRSAFATFYGSVDLPEGLETMAECVFYNSKPSKELILPSTLKSLGRDAFYGATLSLLDFSKSLNLESLGAGAFNNLTLTEKNELDFSNSSKLANFSLINDAIGVFYNNKSHVILPRAMKVLPRSAFATFYGSVDLPEGLETMAECVFYNSKPSKELILPSTLKSLGRDVFYGATLSLLDFSKSLNLESLGAGAFNNLTLTEKNELDFSNSSKLANFSLINDAIGVFYNNKSHVILPRAMKVLPRSAFATFYGSVDLPEGLETMAECVFYNSKPSKELILPSTLKSLGRDAFYGATLSLLDFSKSLNLESLGAGAFNNLTLTEKNELDFSNSSKLANFSLINDAIGVFYNNKSHVILPRAMKVLPRSAFATFYGSVDLPEGLETMAECVFYNSKPSKELILPSTLKSLGRDAFYGATLSLLDFSKSLNLESLGAGAFNNLTLTEKNELDFSNSSKLANFSLINDAIGVFYNNKSHVILPRAMKVLPRSAFATFYGSVDLPEGLETMAECVFYNSKPSKELILPSTLKSLGRDAFYGATLSLLDFSKSLNLESLGAGAFNNLTLTEKNELDFSNSSKLANFSLINDAIGVFYNNKSHVILPRAMKVLPRSAFATFYGSVDLPEGLETIQNCAFLNSSIKEIELPASVTSIGANAFYNCTALEKITSWNATPPALGTNVFYGVNKTTCGLFVPAGGIPLYQVAAQWKDFLIGTYTFDMRLADTNLYRVSNEEPFTIKMPAYMALSVNLGLYTLNGTFLESINKSNDRGLVTCQISNNISDGSYLIQPYILEGGEKKVVSRVSGSHNIDRLPITVENDWWSTHSIRSAVATADISSHLLFKTGASDLLEVTPNQNFNVLVRYKNATTAIKIGLYDALTGTMVADVTESVTGNNYTCKVPASVLPGEYNLIPYELASGKPVFVERGEDVPYLIDRLPLSVVATNTTKSLVADETIDQVNVSVYPNPATDVIHVSGVNIEQLFIYDMSGRRVLTSSGSTSLQIGDLPKGTYILTVKTADGESTHKIIKK